MATTLEIDEILKVMAHKIRTPLSVIQNELLCVKDKITKDEYEAMLSACKSISAILKEPVQALISDSGQNKNE